MVQQITKKKIERASYLEPENKLVKAKIPICRLNSAKGRAYYQRDVKEEERVYIYSSTI